MLGKVSETGSFGLSERSLHVADTADVAHLFVFVVVIVACSSIRSLLRGEPLNIFCVPISE